MREVVARIQLVVAEKLVNRAVELIGPGFDSNVNICSGGGAVNSTGVLLNLELLNGVHRRMDGGGLEERAVIEHAIERIVVVVAAAAGYGKGFALYCLGAGVCAAHRAWDQARQGIEVTAIQRQLQYLGVLDHGTRHADHLAACDRQHRAWFEVEDHVGRNRGSVDAVVASRIR